MANASKKPTPVARSSDSAVSKAPEVKPLPRMSPVVRQRTQEMSRAASRRSSVSVRPVLASGTQQLILRHLEQAVQDYRRGPTDVASTSTHPCTVSREHVVVETPWTMSPEEEEIFWEIGQKRMDQIMLEKVRLDMEAWKAEDWNAWEDYQYWASDEDGREKVVGIRPIGEEVVGKGKAKAKGPMGNDEEPFF